MSSALYESIYNEFYNELTYRLTQAEYARKGWLDGSHDSLHAPLITKECNNPDCKSSFSVLPSDPKKFCSHRCVAHVFNLKRGRFRKTNRCLNCGRLTHRNAVKYCSIICQQEKQYLQFIEKWKIGAIDGSKGINTKYPSSYLRRYLLDKYNGKCSKCKWDLKHPITKIAPLEINHIDGNYENNKEENLEILCPNCHALTSNFRGLNRGKGRAWRLKRYYKGISF